MSTEVLNEGVRSKPVSRVSLLFGITSNRGEAQETRLHKVWTGPKKVGIMHVWINSAFLFLRLVLTSEVFVLLHDNYKYFFDILEFFDFLNFNFVTMFYTRKIKDEHRIMFQATSKETVSPLSNISDYFDVWCPTDFIALKRNALRLKIKPLLTGLQQRLGRQKNACTWSLEKKFAMCSLDLPFCVAI